MARSWVVTIGDDFVEGEFVPVKAVFPEGVIVRSVAFAGAESVALPWKDIRLVIVSNKFEQYASPGVSFNSKRVIIDGLPSNYCSTYSFLERLSDIGGAYGADILSMMEQFKGKDDDLTSYFERWLADAQRLESRRLLGAERREAAVNFKTSGVDAVPRKDVDRAIEAIYRASAADAARQVVEELAS